MNNFDELKKLVEINSFTKNKEGVDANGEIYKSIMANLGFTC